MTLATIPSPLGPLTLEAQDGKVIGLRFGGRGDGPTDPLLIEIAAQLAAYFAGTRTEFQLPLAASGSVLERAVYARMEAIPFGETRTYGDIARDVGAPAQAVGQACGANPLPILIPCHRILGAQTLGGYSGVGGVETKVALLRLEGAAGLLI